METDASVACFFLVKDESTKVDTLHVSKKQVIATLPRTTSRQNMKNLENIGVLGTVR